MTTSRLHYTIIKHIIDKGYAPDIISLSEMLNSDRKEIIEALYDLQEEHGVVLHPMEPKIWVLHPFSLAPTNFMVKFSNKEWWGSCAWCSLGIAALLNERCSITTNLGAHGEQVIIHIEDGELIEKDFFIHFPIPMKKAWDNVIYTCSNMLIFNSEKQINFWTDRHNIAKGDIQPIDNIWELSKKWYGNHLNPNWKKWTLKEAKEIFSEFNLTHKIWDLEVLDSRF
ncbi:MAG: alkylmercury lyase family protein [Ignavibacteriaceae bacterium]